MKSAGNGDRFRTGLQSGRSFHRSQLTGIQVGVTGRVFYRSVTVDWRGAAPWRTRRQVSWPRPSPSGRSPRFMRSGGAPTTLTGCGCWPAAARIGAPRTNSETRIWLETALARAEEARTRVLPKGAWALRTRMSKWLRARPEEREGAQAAFLGRAPIDFLVGTDHEGQRLRPTQPAR